VNSGTGRISSPYDYPRIRSAGNGASQTPPFSPGMNPDPSTFSGAQTSFSSPQISRASREAPQEGARTPQTRHSNSGLPRHLETSSDENVVPQSNMSTPEPNTSVPQPTASTGSYLGLEFNQFINHSSEPATGTSTSVPRSNEVAPQTSTPNPQHDVATPTNSTPRLPKPNLTIQISPVSEQGDPAHQSLGSPFLSRRQHPPSPLVLHSNSASDDSPRTSGEVEALGTSGDIDTLDS
jgi:hypothetical protein